MGLLTKNVDFLHQKKNTILMTFGQKRSFTVWKRSGLRVQMTFLVFVRDWVTSSLLAATKNYFSEARVVVYKRVPFSHNIHFLFFIHQIKPQSFICAITQLQFPPLVRKHDQKLCRENTISTFVYLILLNFRRNLCPWEWLISCLSGRHPWK